MNKHIIFITACLLLLTGKLQAQEKPAYTLKQCAELAVNNNSVAKNASLDVNIAKNKTRQVSAKALPHVEADVDYLHNFNIQHIILENGAVPLFTVPNQPLGSVLAFQLQLQNSLTPSVSASQVLYDQSLFTAVHAADAYNTLSKEKLQKTKTDIVEMVSKAYYAVLVSEKQYEFIVGNLARLDSLYRESNAKYKLGLSRKLDMDRIEVSLNNLKQEREKAQRNVELSRAVLAYHMNIDPASDFVLADSLNEAVVSSLDQSEAKPNYSNRIEYSIIQTQQKINKTEILSSRGAFYPKLSAYATSGYNPAATNAADLFQSSRYYNYTYVGVRLQVPIFDGNAKRLELQNKRLEEEKLGNEREHLERTIGLETKQANIAFSKSVESLSIQKRNLQLAQENVRAVRVENEKGVATNLEVTNSETDLKEAQNNYYNALYQVLLAKVDLDKATGKLNP